MFCSVADNLWASLNPIGLCASSLRVQLCSAATWRKGSHSPEVADQSSVGRVMQVSEGMRSLGTSVYLLSIAIGTYMVSALNIIVTAISPIDWWVADNPLFGHYDW